ncbi:MAG: endonuclease/exonuclease/phosphatase family protein [Actinomycetota bacterium]|nr:endonuclease/exonuclease/phosphatase family protein [Actinomycetota bacterium]
MPQLLRRGVLVACLALSSLLLPLLPVSTVAAQSGPDVTTDKDVYEFGEPITVSWSDAPGNPKDWVGLYPTFSGPPGGSSGATLWDYLDQGNGETATPDGTLTWSERRPGQRDNWPLAPGEYTVYLLVDDGYEVVASTTIRVTGDTDGPEPPPEEEWPANPSDPALSRRLRAMTFNIWVGGTQVKFGSIVRAVRTARAQVVGVQEPGDNLERLASRLGWKHTFTSDDGYTNLISRYPLSAPRRSDEYAWLRFPDGGRVAVSSVHLTPYPYGPYDLRDGASTDYVLFNEQTHLEETRSRLEALSALAEADVPVVLMGDFNVPSHLDWTSVTAAARQADGEDFVHPFPWPLSMSLAEAGFRDSFRTAHPDPVAEPGYTWTPGYPPPIGDQPANLTDDEVFDRIDLIYVHGPVRTMSSRVVGESYRNAHIRVRPWGSDHRAVVSNLRVRPLYPR